MNCPECGKRLPNGAVKCNKCGAVFKNIETPKSVKEKKVFDVSDIQNKLVKDKPNNTEQDVAVSSEKSKDNAGKITEEESNKPHKKLKKIIGIIAIVLVAVILCEAVVEVLVHFEKIDSKFSIINMIKGENDKTTQTESPEYLSWQYKENEVSDDDVILTVGSTKIGKAEYEFFFRQSYSNISNEAKLAKDSTDSSYDKVRGYNSNLALDKQTTKTKDDDGNVISWTDYVRNDAVNTLLSYRTRFNAAIAAGLEFTDSLKYQVYSHIEGLRSSVVGSDAGYSDLSQYLELLFGSSCNEEYFKNELFREYMAAEYSTYITQKYYSGYSADSIKATYLKSRSDYDFADIEYYETDKGEATAEKIAKEASSSASFTDALNKYVGAGATLSSYPAVPKYYIDGNMSEKAGSWIYSSSRKNGDCSVFKTKNGYTIVLVTAKSYSYDVVNYMDTFFSFTDSDSKALSDAKITEKSVKAKKVYDEWVAGGAKEESFKYYAIANSEDTNSSSNGGVVTGIRKGDKDAALSKWLYTANRKKGDYSLIKGSDGYHMVYFTEGPMKYWNYKIRTDKASEDTTAKLAELIKQSKVAWNTAARDSDESSMIENINSIYGFTKTTTTTQITSTTLPFGTGN